MKKLIAGLIFLALFTGSLRSQTTQTPTAATVYSGGTTYDWTPYPSNPTAPIQMTHAWANENQGTPITYIAPPDTRLGGSNGTSEIYIDDNSKAVMAGAGTRSNPEDFFSVSIDMPGDVKLDDPVTSDGNALFVQGYQSITLRRINPATGQCRSGYPLRLDAHVGVCALPRILKDNGGNLYIFWRERTANGDQVIGAHLVVATNTLDETAQSICGTTHYAEIREMTATIDEQADNGAAVVIRNHLGNLNDQIFAQRVSVPGGGGAFTQEWPDVGSTTSFTMRQVGGSGLLPATGKFCPQIAFNAVKTRYEIAWGDNIGSQILVQTETVATPPVENYASGGAVLPTPAAPQAYCEFYMICAKGYLVGTSDSGLTVFYYRDLPMGCPGCTGIGLAMTGFLLNASNPAPTLVVDPTSLTWNYGSGFPHSVANSDGAWPTGLTKRTISSTEEDVVGVYQTGYSTEPGDPAGCHHVGANYFQMSTTPITGLVDADTDSYVPGTFRIEGYVSTNANGTFAVIPDTNYVDVFRVIYSPVGIVMVGQIPTRDIVNPTTSYLPPVEGHSPPALFAAALGSTNLGIQTYEYGVNESATGLVWQAENLYASEDYNHETDERPRETDFQPNEYNFTNCITLGYGPYLTTSAPVGIENNTFDYNPHTAVYNDYTATVYEELDAHYNSNIILGVIRGIGQLPKFVLTSCTTGDTVYYEPKIVLGAGLGCGTDTFAIVTYISVIQAPWATQQYCYRLIDLTTGVIGAENAIAGCPTGAGIGYFRNWDVVHDMSTPGYIFIFGEQYVPTATRMFGGQLDAIVFDACGYYVGSNVLRSFNGNTQDEVRACLDPDPMNTGTYVTWRETPSSSTNPGDAATIDLVQINTGTYALWIAGVIQHIPGSSAHRGEPVVAAGQTWVMLAWADMQSGTSKIWGCSHDNTGITILQPPGILSYTSVEAHHPDIIANPALFNIAMVAWDEDCDGGANSPINVRVMNCLPLGGIMTGTTVAIYTPHATPHLAGGAGMNDALWSMYGYMLRRPKLIAMYAPSEIWPYDWSRTWLNLNYWILCAYECEAYNLYGTSGPTCGINPLMGKYQLMWNAESPRPGGPYSGYLQNNIVAKVLNPSLSAGFSPNQPLIGGEMCLAAGTNAQDLYTLDYSSALGPVVGVLDYANSSNSNAIARTMIARPYYYNPPWSPLPVLAGVWYSPTDSHISSPVYINCSWEPMFIHPAVGSSLSIVPPGTWTVDATTTTITVAPNMLAWPDVDYVSPGYINPLRVTGYVESIAGQWPLSTPDAWGEVGSVSMPGMGYGLKAADGSNPISDGALQISIADNPANAATAARIEGIAGITATIRVLNLLGNAVQTIDAVTIEAGGSLVPLMTETWPSGNYIVEAIGNEGSHASVVLTVTH